MNFTQEVPCDCGGTFPFSAYGDEPWPVVVCTKCGKPAGQINPLSVSVTAERLLYRSKKELENGDYSLSIIMGTIAVETYLVRLFLKTKRMEAKIYNRPTRDQEIAWELLYPTTGGFPGHADVVSKETTGTTFDAFVVQNSVAIKVMDGFPNAKNISAKKYFQDELFYRRNRIVHWGDVNYKPEEAQLCLDLAIAIVTILREMDKSKYGSL